MKILKVIPDDEFNKWSGEVHAVQDREVARILTARIIKTAYNKGIRQAATIAAVDGGRNASREIKGLLI